MKNQRPRRTCCFDEDDTETGASSNSDEARLSKAQEESKFLQSLPNAETLSIRLLEFRSPRNFMRGVFRLELKTTAANATDETSYDLEMDGIKDPNASWPVYAFKVPEPQQDLLLHSLLPALMKASKKHMPLQSLTLQGCGRIEGFHTPLLNLLFKSEVNNPPNVLSILHWTDFCSNVDWDLAQEIMLMDLTNLKIEYGPKMEEDTFEKLCNSLSPQLEELHLKTGIFEESHSWLQWRYAFAKLTKLKDLTWVTHCDYRCQPSPPQSPESQEILRDLCETWQSLPLRKLNLGWNHLDESLLRILLLGGECSLPLEDVSLHMINDGCGSALGAFLKHNHGLRRLSLTLPFHDQEDDHVEITGLCRVLEQSKNHPALEELEIKNVPLSCVEQDDVTDVMRSVLSGEASVLRDFSVTLCTSKGYQDLILQTIELGIDKKEDPVCLPSLYRSIFAGLRDNNGILQSLRLENCEVTLDELSSQTFYEALISNSALLSLDLGKCCIPKSKISEKVVHELGRNKSLQRLNGIFFMDDENQESARSILQCNKNILHVSSVEENMLKKSSNNAVDFYLKLNNAGRKHWIDSHFNAALMPHLLASASSDPNRLCYMLQSKAELIPHAA